MNRRNKSFAREYMGCRHTPKKEMHWEFIRLAMASPAKLAVIPVQDYLGLGQRPGSMSLPHLEKTGNGDCYREK